LIDYVFNELQTNMMRPKRRAEPPRVVGGLKNTVTVPIKDTTMATIDKKLPL
jgi:hypothetical protein